MTTPHDQVEHAINVHTHQRGERKAWAPSEEWFDAYNRYATEPRTTYASLAREFGLTPATVKNKLRVVQEMLAEDVVKDVNIHRVDQIKKLEWAARESQLAWEASKGEKRTVRTITKGTSEDGEKTYTDVTTTTSQGMPTYLAEFRMSLADIRKITGADAPEKLALSVQTDEMPIGDQLKDATARLRGALGDRADRVIATQESSTPALPAERNGDDE